ncbi:hypothetical protein [Prosthecomicrobium sp. N25]
MAAPSGIGVAEVAASGAEAVGAVEAVAVAAVDITASLTPWSGRRHVG